MTHARNVADVQHTRTGTPIDTLRARLGVPAPMADAIAAQLTCLIKEIRHARS